ncbi:Uncharacterized protein FKW44_005960 [Caligus rogercresseyi]|uniref:Uncharacterized protein n=1 Tax=Caligus rogercresseyi TaxID=217165 RepID=A0A7T8KCQ5_CALRO|nr:Uncharacterized protein FKW44_005960 [Caligus rogercresseyi]
MVEDQYVWDSSVTTYPLDTPVCLTPWTTRSPQVQIPPAQARPSLAYGKYPSISILSKEEVAGNAPI